MKDIKKFLYGKKSKEQMNKFSIAIADLNKKFDLEKDDKIENHIVINWNAGKNKNSIKTTELSQNIENEINSIFNEIFK
jgi:hypothetical protein